MTSVCKLWIGQGENRLKESMSSLVSRLCTDQPTSSMWTGLSSIPVMCNRWCYFSQTATPQGDSLWYLDPAAIGPDNADCWCEPNPETAPPRTESRPCEFGCFCRPRLRWTLYCRQSLPEKRKRREPEGQHITRKQTAVTTTKLRKWWNQIERSLTLEE